MPKLIRKIVELAIPARGAGWMPDAVGSGAAFRRGGLLRSKEAWILLLILTISACNNRRFSAYFTMSPTSYKPYDNKFFYDELKKANKSFTENEISLHAYGSNLNNEKETDSNLVFIFMLPRFRPDEEEVKALKEFVARGNTALILSYSINKTLRDSLFYQVDESNGFLNSFPPRLERANYKIRWNNAIDSTLNKTNYSYPGHTPITAPLDSVYTLGNNAVTEIEPLLMRSGEMPQMLRMSCGKGIIYYCNSPIMFSNYFLLHKNNYRFLNEFIKEVGLDTRYIIWDKYYRNKKNETESTTLSRVLGIIHQYPPLKWAFYTFLSGVLLFALIYFRRTLRQVAIIPPKKNSALGFTNVLSNLYWNRQDHAAIATKIVQHLHEYLYTKFQIYNKDFTIENVDVLAQKINVDELLIKDIIRQFEQLNNGIEVDKDFLNGLYTNTQKLYTRTGQ